MQALGIQRPAATAGIQFHFLSYLTDLQTLNVNLQKSNPDHTLWSTARCFLQFAFCGEPVHKSRPSTAACFLPASVALETSTQIPWGPLVTEWRSCNKQNSSKYAQLVPVFSSYPCLTCILFHLSHAIKSASLHAQFLFIIWSQCRSYSQLGITFFWRY